MLADFLILNAKVVNEGKIETLDVAVKASKIIKIDKNLSHWQALQVIDAQGQYLIPGVIDDQVHFREPGLTHKASIYTESRAAVAGGVTSFMEMPNTVPPTLTQDLLQAKYDLAAKTSLANYSFYMGVSNDNLDEVMKTNAQHVCGIKIFMGSSTGNLLVDNEQVLEKIFNQVNMLIATHCEDENTIRENTANYKKQYPKAQASLHPLIRSSEACYLSSQKAIKLAKKYGTRLHILHISTATECNLLENESNLETKQITSEACVHHLWFNNQDYKIYGNQIKCNPAIKSAIDQEAILKAVKDNRIDVIATDHAPHTYREKDQAYWQAPSGVPLVQHGLLMMLEFYQRGLISLETIIEKMCHAPSLCFKLSSRGFIREGYWADLVLLDLNQKTKVTKDNIFYKCGWSPFLNYSFKNQITHTFVSGHLAYQNGQFFENQKGKRLEFGGVK